MVCPVRVVRDDDLLVTYLQPGTRYLLPDTVADSHDAAWWDEIASGWTLREATWHTHHRLLIYRPGAAHAVSGFWSEDGRFASWYVDFIEPLRRTEHGFDFRDLVLDMVVAADMSFAMKDEVEFDRARELGLISSSTAKAVLAEVEVVKNVLATPWWRGWERWKPDPSWEPSGLDRGPFS